jgi:pimeloyl-ACP methyl ester carboxylesterase
MMRRSFWCTGPIRAVGSGSVSHQAYVPQATPCMHRPWTAVPSRRHQLRPGIDTSTYVAEIADLLLYEDLHDVVLVGTSSGGMVVCGAAERMRHRVAHLVLVDALALFNGECTRDIVRGATAVPPELAYAPPREDAEQGLFADLDPATRACVLDRYTPHPTGCSAIPVKLTDFWDQSWKTTVIWCRRAPNPGEAHQRRAAARLGARWLELDTGHYPMLSMPDELTQMLIDAG